MMIWWSNPPPSKKNGFRQTKIGYFLSDFKTGNIERIPGPKPCFNMIRKIILAEIYVEIVFKERYALYFLLWNMKKNSFLLYAFLRDCRNPPIAWRHRDTRNKWCCKNSWFLYLTYLVLYALKISVWNDVFYLTLWERGQKIDLIENDNELDILNSSELTT